MRCLRAILAPPSVATWLSISALRPQPTSGRGATVRTPARFSPVRAWLDGCHIAWLVCESKGVAKSLEDDFKAEYKPPLTKR